MKHIKAMGEVIDAVKDNDLEKLAQLISSGSYVDDRDNRINNTALTWAVYLDSQVDNKIVDYLIRNGARLNEQNIFGDTALMIATRQCNLAAVKSLIIAGADIDITNNQSKNPLSEAKRLLNNLHKTSKADDIKRIIEFLEDPREAVKPPPLPKFDMGIKRRIPYKGPIKFN